MELATIPSQGATIAELLDLCQTRLGMTASAAATHVMGLINAATGERSLLAQGQGAEATLELVAGTYRLLPSLI